jgi:hypothetical protein
VQSARERVKAGGTRALTSGAGGTTPLARVPVAGEEGQA